MRIVSPVAFSILLTIATNSSLPAQSIQHLLFRNPSISATQIVFEYADDLWIVLRDGGDARRLTNGVGRESNPCFSPDGTQIAFTGEYEGNSDVYVLPAAGGIPRRLTYHPGFDAAVGWSPDGKTFYSTHVGIVLLIVGSYTQFR